jgi:hypothetical protein
MGGWSNTGLDELVIPSGATSGIRTVYGGTTPAELTAYGLSTVSRRIYTADADTYWFEGFQTAGSNQRIIRGWVINGVVTVTETEIYSTGLGNIQLTFDQKFIIGGDDNGLLRLENPEVQIYQNGNTETTHLHTGTRYHKELTASVGPVAAETALITTDDFTWQNGRVWELTWGANLVGSVVASGRAHFRIRKTNVAGALLLDGFTMDIVNTHSRWGQFTAYLANSSFNSTYTGAVCLTITPLGGASVTVTGSASTRPYFDIKDAGDVTDYAQTRPVTVI